MTELEPQPTANIKQSAERIADMAGQWAHMTTRERNDALLTMLAGVVVDIDERAVVEWRVRAAYRNLVKPQE